MAPKPYLLQDDQHRIDFEPYHITETPRLFDETVHDSYEGTTRCQWSGPDKQHEWTSAPRAQQRLRMHIQVHRSQPAI